MQIQKKTKMRLISHSEFLLLIYTLSFWVPFINIYYFSCSNPYTPYYLVLIISQVFPVPGQESGGAKITIYGKNIGNPKDNITVEIDGVECTNVEVLRPSSM